MCTVNWTGGNGPNFYHGRFILHVTEKFPLEGIIKPYLLMETAESPPLEIGTGTNGMKSLCSLKGFSFLT